MNTRQDTTTQKVKTPFGSMYIHIDRDEAGETTGGWISDPGKDCESTIAELVTNLSRGLDAALKGDTNET